MAARHASGWSLESAGNSRTGQMNVHDITRLIVLLAFLFLKQILKRICTYIFEVYRFFFRKQNLFYFLQGLVQNFFDIPAVLSRRQLKSFSKSDRRSQMEDRNGQHPYFTQSGEDRECRENTNYAIGRMENVRSRVQSNSKRSTAFVFYL